ncbi:hypothetical protein QO259_05520 [Salinicola sp. JS01]|uniref:hypothetical protein n=1 Tax=Salinicola sp. JS01 TaxID=3050071 RepID=UPI00255B5E0D|nr:hypothetical protein [Salinicola sp. JS01]WIX34121.1 hypothetical protein QO259_05520 [Salinicola sp. JS01]
MSLTDLTPPAPVTLTSADRILLARLTDLAVDITNQGKLVCNAAYMGFARRVHVWWQPATGGEMQQIEIALSAEPETVRSELAQAIQTLEALLTQPGDAA